MKRTLFYVGVILLTILILLVGNICFAESGQPTSTCWFWKSDTGEWYRAQVDEMGNLWVITSSNSITQARNYYWDAGEAAWVMGLANPADHQIVETDTDSVTSVYYNGNKAVVRDGSTDNNSPSEQGLLIQSNLHGYDSNSWNRLLIQSTNYHNLRTAIYNDDKVWEIEDWDSDDEASGNDGGPVYAKLKGWDGVNEDWDRVRLNPMKYLYVQTSTDSTVSIYYNGIKAVIQADGQLWVETSTDSTASIYYNGNKAIVQGDGELEVETSTDSTVSVYYNGNKAEVDSGNDLIIEDTRYQNMVSTGTAGKIFASGNIAVTNYSMDAYTFYSVGGDSTILSTWHDGTIYALEGVPISPQKLSIPVVNPTFQCTLPAETTLYYILHGVQ
jgi:hypothetical protein